MFTRKILIYNFGALEPYIDGETMNVHYNEHYKKYTDELNSALAENSIQDLDIETILKLYSNDEKIKNNGGGYYNHTLYFENISPFGFTYNFASDYLKDKINQNFGDLFGFLKAFKKEGLDIFGSGWVWLVERDGNLSIVKTKNQDNPIMYDGYCKVLLGMDVWEHAYYLKHRSKRADYIDDFFKVIDWRVVSNRLKSYKQWI